MCARRSSVTFLVVAFASSFWLQSPADAQSCPQLDYELLSQSDVDAFPSSCREVAGSLRISGTDIVDLTPLAGLTTVGGSLVIEVNHSLATLSGVGNIAVVGRSVTIYQNKQLTSVDGLSSLNQVGEDLTIRSNYRIENLDSLSGLETIGRMVTVEDNYHLRDLHGLGGLRHIGGLDPIVNYNGITVRYNESLASISFPLIQRINGAVYISGNPLIAEVDFPALESIDGSLRLGQTRLIDLSGFSKLASASALLLERQPQLTSLAALSKLESVTKISLSNVPLLVNLEGLERLRVLDSFSATSDSSLSDISGLSGLNTVGNLAFQGNESLRNLAGLSGITSVTGKLTLNGNPVLEALDGLSSLEAAYTVEVIGNDALLNLRGLEHLRSIGRVLLVGRNRSLRSLDGLDSLQRIGSGFSIYENESLVQVDALSQLDSLDVNLNIADNPVLANVDGLQSIEYVGGTVTVARNSTLSMCSCGLFDLIAGGGVGGAITLERNALDGDCNNDGADLMPNACPSGVRVIYVDADATGAHTGRSWTDAYTHPSTAIATAHAGDQIWVAEGSYPADMGTGDCYRSIAMKDGVQLYGGFAGVESALDERDIENHETVLTGELTSPQCNRSISVLTTAGVTRSALVDGFTVTRGGGDDVWHTLGAGIYNEGGSPTLRNLTVVDNYATADDVILVFGGIGLMTAGDPLVEQSVFRANSGTAGAILITDGSPEFRNVLIEGNYGFAWYGAVQMRGSGNPLFEDVTFRENFANAQRGYSNVHADDGVYPTFRRVLFEEENGNGWYSDLDIFAGRLEDVTFYNNPRAPIQVRGKASLTNLRFIGNAGPNRLDGQTLSNVLYVNNSEKITGSNTWVNATFAYNTNPYGPWPLPCGTYENSVIWGNAVDTTCAVAFGNSIVEGGIPPGVTDLGGNLSDDPMFSDVDGADGISGNLDDDFRLLDSSPGIDAGSSIWLPADSLDLDGDGNTTEPLPIDLDGNERLFGSVVDIGAYESSGALPILLESFSAVVDGGSVVLNWRLASSGAPSADARADDADVDGDIVGFVVQRSTASEGDKPLAGQANESWNDPVDDPRNNWVDVAWVGAAEATGEQGFTATIPDMTPGTYRLRLRLTARDGSVSYSQTVLVSLEPTEAIFAAPIYPNPTNDRAILRFGVRNAQHVGVALYDAIGRRVRVLYDDMLGDAVTRDVVIDGESLAPGLYYCRVRGESGTVTQAVVIL